MYVGIEKQAAIEHQQQIHGENMIRKIVIIIKIAHVFQGRTMQSWRGQSIHQKHGVRQASITLPKSPKI
jgi:hypothetical protein